MKRLLILFSGLILAAGVAQAVVAPKTPFRYTQPDGSVVTLVNHGDEFHHWTTCDGVRVEMDGDGFYRPARDRGAFERQAAVGRTLRQEAAAARAATLRNGLGTGAKHFLVILVEFDDLEFTVENPSDAFSRMLNEPGYSENGGTGSARDYYVDNSMGVFLPTYDVVGPVKLSKGYAYYGGGSQDDHAEDGFYEACELLDGQINFSQYDLDKNGKVDNIFFYYAGHNEAEGGGSDTIWPYKSSLEYRGGRLFDGVRLASFACTSEYRGNSGSDMAGIGTFVHEFGHVLGLPDLYDVNYESFGSAANPEYFSTMACGNYLNDGRTPPYFTSLERQLLGWMGEFPTVSVAGAYELEPVGGNNLPWVIPTDVEGETFILEMRGGSGWDAYLPRGMVVFHLDRSEVNSVGEWTAKKAWGNGYINVYASHPCYYVVHSKSYGKSEDMIFPGSGDIHTFEPRPWSGEPLPYYVTDIRLNGDKVRFNLEITMSRTLRGTVLDAEGTPLGGATVGLGVPQKTDAAPGRRRPRNALRASEYRYTATTASDGSYVIELDEDDNTPAFLVTASREGYIEQTEECSFELIGRCVFYLRKAGSPGRAGLRRYDPDRGEDYITIGWDNDDGNNSIMAAIYYTEEEISPYVGMEIREISFLANVLKAKSVHALVYSERGLVRAVDVGTKSEDGVFTADLSGEKLKIVPGTGIYFGYAIDGKDMEPVVIQELDGVDGLYYSTYNLDNATWYSFGDYALVATVTLYDPNAAKYITLASLGFTSIANPGWKEGYSAGDTFEFRLLEAPGAEVTAVSWQYDGKGTADPSVVLTAGKHTVSAYVKYKDGTEEELTLELDVR